MGPRSQVSGTINGMCHVSLNKVIYTGIVPYAMVDDSKEIRVVNGDEDEKFVLVNENSHIPGRGNVSTGRSVMCFFFRRQLLIIK